ncbi:MAG: AAA family ATPase, partial [Phormidesmis sp.]
MVGLSGSGKSTTARSLAAQAQAVHLRSDAIRKH